MLRNGLKVWVNIDFRMRYFFDLRVCEQNCYGTIVEKYASNTEDPCFSKFTFSANEYLLPIISSEAYERVAHEMLEMYFPSAQRMLLNEPLTGEMVAKKMGLRIETVSFADPTVMGQIFYDFEVVEVKDHLGRPYQREVHPGTILLSKENCSTPALRNSTISSYVSGQMDLPDPNDGGRRVCCLYQ